MTITTQRSKNGKYVTATIEGRSLERLDKLTKDYNIEHDASALVFIIETVSECEGKPIPIRYRLKTDEIIPHDDILKKED